MLRKILVDGLLTALLLVAISLLFNLLLVNVDFINNFMSISLIDSLGQLFDGLGGLWAIFVVGLAIGVVNALLVPFVMKLFKKASGIILFVITVIVDAAALILISVLNFIPFTIGGSPQILGFPLIQAIILGLILAAVGPIVFKREMFGKKR